MPLAVDPRHGHGACSAARSTARSCRSRTRSRAASTPRSTRWPARPRDVRDRRGVVLPMRHCLIARARDRARRRSRRVDLPPPGRRAVRALPARASCRAPRCVPAGSTAEAVRTVAEADEPWAALGPRLAAELYGCGCCARGSRTSPATRPASCGSRGRRRARRRARRAAPWKTSIVFWGVGDASPGWLVRCLSEFAFRGVNLTKIESRPLRAAARPLHVLRRPRGPRGRRRGGGRRRGARTRTARRARARLVSGSLTRG